MIARFRNPASWFVAACITYVALHARAVCMSPSFDDWPVIELSRSEIGLQGLVRGLLYASVQPLGDFWRPLHVLFSAAVFGDSAALSQSIKLIAVVALAYLLVRVAREAGLDHDAAWVSGIVLLLHQCMVLGGEIDRWGDVILTICFTGILWNALRVLRATVRVRYYVVVSVLCTTAAVLSKEAGVAAPLIPLASALLIARDSGQRRAHLKAGIGSAVVVALYVFIRYHIGVGIASTDPTGVYSLRVGSNLVQNVVLVSFGLLSPVNTVRVVTEAGVWMGAAVLLALILGGAVLWGGVQLVRERNWRIPLLLACLFVAVQGPSLLMRSISEPNIARSLPFGVLLIMMTIATLWRVGAARPLWLGLTLAAALGLHMQATAEKVGDLRIVADRAHNFRDAVYTLMPVPPDHPVSFAAEKTYDGYSCYVEPLWRTILGDADSGMRLRYADRNFVGIVNVLDTSTVSDPGQTSPDFTLDRRNRLTSADGRTVEIAPPDVYLDREILGMSDYHRIWSGIWD